MRFRKKPVVVDAVQFDPHGKHRTALPEGVTAVDWHGGADNYAYAGVSFYVVTAHGQKTEVKQDDWIISEPDGRGHYPCKPDIFDATYERADV
jgi:hypothetical protein